MHLQAHYCLRLTNPKVADALPPDLQLALSALEAKDSGRGGGQGFELVPWSWFGYGKDRE